MTRVVLITGVSGGIGRSTAAKFTEQGWAVIGVDRVPPAFDVRRFALLDVSAADVHVRIQELLKKGERIDALINNAAIQVTASLLDTTLESWDASYRTNLRGPALVTQAVVPFLASPGAVVNVSSVHAVATSAGLSAYAASKAGLAALTRAAAIELAGRHIRVNAVLPGAIDTAMLREGVKRMGGATVDESLARLGERVPLGRLGTPDDVAEAILFLADGQRSSYITGHCLVVDGGATAQLATERLDGVQAQA